MSYKITRQLPWHLVASSINQWTPAWVIIVATLCSSWKRRLIDTEKKRFLKQRTFAVSVLKIIIDILVIGRKEAMNIAVAAQASCAAMEAKVSSLEKSVFKLTVQNRGIKEDNSYLHRRSNN